MRRLFAALALAGALAAVCAPASAQSAASDVLRALPATHGVRAIIVEAALTEGVDPRVALAVARVESGMNPRARGARGEYGLCQTARGLGFAGACGALLDPRVNARWGVRHLALALRRGSIGFHQAGLGAVRFSAGYVRKVNAAM
jgi:soluble lytic murein transglycosylase-like protein